MKPSSQTGFTLVEAMAAIVILTMSLFATYSWINVSIETLIRSDQVLVQELMVADLIDEIDSVNLDERRSGELQRDDYELSWDARLREKKSGKNNLGTQGFYDHTFYDVHIQITRRDQLIAEYVTRKVESELVRFPSEALEL